ncbi:MAG: hypothetical protein ACC654_13340 [Acidimicrobiia bacterium]
MSGFKLGVFAVAWVLASLTIGVVTAIMATEVFSWLGIVESGESSYAVSLNVIALVVFLVLIAVPFAFRKRFVDAGRTNET